jgi:hypothetical protein
VVAGLRGSDLEAVVPSERVERVARTEGAVAAGVEWLTEFWAARQTRAWVLAQTPLLHVYGHYFEAPAAPYENVTLSGRKRGAGAERPRRLT